MADGNYTREMHGRRVLRTSVENITEENVLSVILKVSGDETLNRSEIDYLWNYYRGDQPILRRVKTVRPEICNKIVENRANEIVSFKVGYLCGEPIQYVNRTGDSSVSDEIGILNDYMFCEDKATLDQEVVEWQMICGTAYRLILPRKNSLPGESPFEMYTLDPRDTFVIYSYGVDARPIVGVMRCEDDDHIVTYSVYTDRYFYKIREGLLVESVPHALGMIPIFEYPANNARLGSFEIVLPLLDMINNIDSNRMDGIEQTIQSFIKFINCNIDADTFADMKELGAIKVNSTEGLPADVDVVKNELNQNQSHTLKEDCYNAILTICGMPNRNGGSSTSDTGAAVLLRDGWSLAEARAKDSEHLFKKAEKKMLRLVLKICRELGGINIILSDIDMKFTRRNYEAIQSKSQVLISMLDNPKIHPLLAYEHCGMFTDPEGAYALGMKYYEEEQSKWEPITVGDTDGESDVQ